MSGEHRIEFGEGEVIKPEFSPENELVAVYVSDAGLESLREAVCEPQPPDETPEDGNSGPSLAEDGPLAGAMSLDSAVLDIGMAVIELNAYVPAEMREE